MENDSQTKITHLGDFCEMFEDRVWACGDNGSTPALYPWRCQSESGQVHPLFLNFLHSLLSIICLAKKSRHTTPVDNPMQIPSANTSSY